MWDLIDRAEWDGTPYLTSQAHSGVMYVAWFSRAHAMWVFYDDGRGEVRGYAPTHFQPLPEPPAREEPPHAR